MRVLVVTPWYPTADAPESGIFIAREVAALASSDQVRVLHLDWSGPHDRAPAPGTPTVTRVGLSRANPWDWFRARRMVRRAARDADVVHTHALTGLLPWLWGRPARGPWVHSEHWSALTAPQTLPRMSRAVLTVLLPTLRRPDVAVAECERLASALRAHRRGPVHIVPCVVPPASVVERPPERYALVAVGGLIERKDPLLAVDVIARLRARGHDATLEWVGDGPLRSSVQERAALRGVQGWVVLRGTSTAQQVGEALDRASLFILPTRADNFCVAAAEALVHGRPVVSGAETGAVDYAEESVSRFLATRDADAYADAVEELTAATAGFRATDIAATVADAFTPEVVRAGLREAYEVAGARR